jgi:hypothetical protein
MFFKFKKKITEKRSYERILTSISIKCINGNSIHEGLVSNISKNGMYFITDANLSLGLNSEVSIPYKEDVLKVPVRIIRTVKGSNFIDGFGVILSSLPKDYLEFVDNL